MKNFKQFNEEKVNEGFSWILTTVATYFLYKAIKGFVNRNKEPETEDDSFNRLKDSEKRRDDGQFSILISHVKNFLKNGGEVEYEDNGWYHLFKLDDIVVRINQGNNNMDWTNLIGNWKKIANYKKGARIEYGDLGDDTEHEFSKPIGLSQEEVDSLVDNIKKDTNQ